MPTVDAVHVHVFHPTRITLQHMIVLATDVAKTKPCVLLFRQACSSMQTHHQPRAFSYKQIPSQHLLVDEHGPFAEMIRLDQEVVSRSGGSRVLKLWIAAGSACVLYLSPLS